MWIPGKPNGGEPQSCTGWEGNGQLGNLYDLFCYDIAKPRQCLCQFENPPILRLRGLCTKSYIDRQFTLKYGKRDGSITFMGLSGKIIKFSTTSPLPKWELKVNVRETQEFAENEEKDYILGRNTWILKNDSVGCEKGEQ